MLDDGLDEPVPERLGDRFWRVSDCEDDLPRDCEGILLALVEPGETRLDGLPRSRDCEDGFPVVNRLEELPRPTDCESDLPSVDRLEDLPRSRDCEVDLPGADWLEDLPRPRDCEADLPGADRLEDLPRCWSSPERTPDDLADGPCLPKDCLAAG
jgi:hypothetical protein